MRKLKRKIEADKLILLFVAFSSFVFLNNVGSQNQPFSSALLFAVLYSGANALLYSAVFLLSFLFNFSLQNFASALAISLILCVIYGVFARKRKMNITSLIFLLASLIPYVLIGGKSEYFSRFITSVFITVTSACFIPVVDAFALRGLRKLEKFEILSLILLFVCVFSGGIKYIGLDGYKALSLFLLAIFSVLFQGVESCLVALILAIPHAISLKSAEIFAPYMVFGFLSFVFSGKSKPLYSIVMIMGELIGTYLFDWYGEYGYVNLIYVCSALILFSLIPEKLLKSIEERLALSSEKPLTRYEINRTRNIISGRLYEISGTFREISELFNTISKTENPFIYEDAIIEETDKICENCVFYSKCKATNFPSREDVTRLIAIAKGKGKLNSVDLPKKFTQKCNQTGKILFAINKYVALYSTEIEKRKASESTRALVGLQADGVASALKGIAKNLSKTLSYKTNKENKLSRFLLKKGVNVQETMIFGESESIEIHLIIKDNCNENKVIASVNEFFKIKFRVIEKFVLPSEKTALILELANKYDCVFGVATQRKNGEQVCGDTHSLIKIARNKYMLALSDGMGSGQVAKATSQASLSLIECFYKVGLPAEVTLSMVNKLLSFSSEDNFTALDLAVINLENLSCDFIKLGAPYGFIVSRGVVRLIEGSSLPMGILSELKPSVCTEAVIPGDVIIFLSDGVTDAFGSATDFADFLIATSISNPQKLADKILDKAYAMYGDKASDDMTVVACKIFAS